MVICSAMHASNTQSAGIQLLASTCSYQHSLLIIREKKTFCRQVFISHKKPRWKMIVWLKHCAGIQETKVHAYNPTKCLAGAFSPHPGLSPFPSLPLGHRHWYPQSIPSQGKKSCPSTETLPETITHSPKRFPSKLPHCYFSAFKVTIGEKLSLIESGNISVSLQRLISNWSGFF